MGGGLKTELAFLLLKLASLDFKIADTNSTKIQFS